MSFVRHPYFNFKQFLTFKNVLRYNVSMENKKKKTKKKFKTNIKTMGIDIDKNEYREIVLSQSNHPERSFKDFF